MSIKNIHYKAVSTPASAQDVEDMYRYISEASSVASLLTSLNDAEVVETHVVVDIGELLVRLLSQPMEAASGLCNEKGETADN